MDRILTEALLRRAERDLEALFLPDRNLFLTGLPNFRRFFGRDELWSVFQLLSLPHDHPIRVHYAASIPATLRLLAKHQVLTKPKPWNRVMREASFGKIPHEIPRDVRDWLWLKAHYGIGYFRGHPYYGSVDATPLFVSAIAKYTEEPEGPALARELEEHLRAAIAWVEKELLDGGGFIRYRKQNSWNPKQHTHHGWKDGAGKHGLGPLRITEPIALVEVQGYAYRALRDMRSLAPVLKMPMRDLDRLAEIAARLRKDILQKFWMPSEKTFALALNGNNEQVRVVTSNAAHLLWAGVISAEDRYGAGVRRTLLDSELLATDFGVRTHSVSDKFFDESSYHRGTVWPHDNWVIYRGLRNSPYVALTQTFRQNALRGIIAVGRNDELYGVTNDGAMPFHIGKAASPQLWTTMATASFAADELASRR